MEHLIEKHLSLSFLNKIHLNKISIKYNLIKFLIIIEIYFSLANDSDRLLSKSRNFRVINEIKESTIVILTVFCARPKTRIISVPFSLIE